jgi:hypothetical protein
MAKRITFDAAVPSEKAAENTLPAVTSSSGGV